MARFKRIHNIYSRLADKENINNYPGVDQSADCKLTPDFIWSNLNKLHDNCVYPICQAFNNEIKITGAYRCMALTKALGGPPTSPHIYGYAIDLVALNNSSADVFNWCLQNLPHYHQLIWEYPERNHFANATMQAPFPNIDITKFSWVHISYIEGDNPKTNSVSSKREDLHEMYKSETTNRIGKYTHGIVFADDKLL